jgi:hypothetical protein
MVSTRLVHQIEDHWSHISGRFLRLLLTCEEPRFLSHITESEASDACRRALGNLGNWLVSGSDSVIVQEYERIGAERHRHGTPLSVAIRCVQLMKDATIGYIHDEGTISSTIDLYAEEELENRLGRFFDVLIFHLARGYEKAGEKKSHYATVGSL